MKFTSPVISEIIVCFVNLISGISGIMILIMIYLHKEKLEQYSSSRRLNTLLITDIAISFILFIYLNYFIEDISVQTYILNESYFNCIIIALILNQVTCLFFNLKMAHFAQECQRVDILAIPLLE